ncbi:polysaccharide pyruvyl transferase family protein [Caviibacterium pharyngocola]|uniref:Polysaccharide pyruvyl transferase n=1 Tax=Caviibacterium pharyngocola TaxID=28159 RepID=A0A2M8RTK4_9PAST|nr:polysaccharide pyruvyl transferase family protein [Caviibacterium pharyngocola]PJG82209.1 polysaccharide pyruvyl transferase [Caviibacterium pharyngocola]
MNEILVSLKQDLSKILDVIINKDDVLYFDYPLHLNVGDLLIYAGTERFFQDYGINIRLRRCLQSFDINEVKKYVNADTTLLCHGGGNFGDLYPSIQQLREALVRAFPHNRIVVLPQTSHFSSQDALQKSAALFSAHKDCYLFARDVPTFELMREHFSDKVFLSPDMAHQLYGTLPTKAKSAVENSTENNLYFLRKDIEASHLEKEIQAHLPASAAVKDWEDILTEQDKKYELFCGRLARVANKLHWAFLKNKVNEMWFAHSLDVIERARQEFLRYDCVITSRLHGHIFSCLLELPNQVCDNSYGKNSGYFNQWTKNIEFTKKYER